MRNKPNRLTLLGEPEFLHMWAIIYIQYHNINNKFYLSERKPGLPTKKRARVSGPTWAPVTGS